MLKITDLSLKRDGITLFEHLDLTVHVGQKVAIVGRNGVGKSTLFDLILGNLQPDTGDITFPRDWRIGHMAQDVEVTDRAALDYVIDGDKALRGAQKKLAAAEADGDDMEIANCHIRLDDLGAYQADARAGEILHGLGFSGEDATRAFADFSGGWRIRLNLAKALMAPTDLLLLDEPTNHLDLEATIWLENWLQRYPGTLIIIAHDREFLDNVANHTVHLTNHHANTYRGNYSAFEMARAEALVLQQAAFTKQQREIAHIQSFVTRFRAKASKAKQAQSRLKALERMEAVAPIHADSPYQLNFPNPERMSTPLMNLDHLDIGYGDTTILHDVRASILPGARIGVLGENGAGKSTLLKCLVGELQPQAGELVVGQHARVGYFAQHQLESLRSDASALNHIQTLKPDQREQVGRDYLASWGFPKAKVDRAVSTLSGGERARLVLALIAAQRPAILVLDEPTNHLDLDMRDALAMALQDFEGALIIVAHDRSLLSRTVNEFWLVADGTVTRLDSDLADYARAHSPGQPIKAPSTRASTKASTKGAATKVAAGNPDRRKQRKTSAQQRQQEKPLTDSIKALDKELDKLNSELASVEQRLADPDIYHKLPPEELDDLLKQAGKIRKRRDDAETRWLADSERLEQLQANTQS